MLRALACSVLALLVVACTSGGDGTTDGSADGARPDGARPDGTTGHDGATDAPGFVDFGPPDMGVDLGPAPDADVPAPIVSFCGSLAQAICDGATACMCAGIDATTCRAHQEQQCEAPFHDPRLESAITAGTLHFDATAGDALVAATRAMPACDAASPVPLTTAQLTTFAGTFTGTLGDGAACMAVVDGSIAPTTCAMPDVCASGTCAPPFVDLGASCGATTTCIALSSLATAPVYGRCVSGTCAALGGDGDACAMDVDCTSGVCNTGGTCDGPYAVGHACTLASQCPGVCNAGTCGRGLTGDACGGDAECKSGTCNGGHCAGTACVGLAF